MFGFEPVLPFYIIIPLTVALLVAIFMLSKKAGKSSNVLRKRWLRRLAVPVILCLLILRPGIYEMQEMETYSTEYDIYFVVDTTASMVAEDNGPDSPTRLDMAKDDMNYIMDSFIGSKFSLIAFDKTAKVISPLISDATSVSKGIDSLVPELTRNSSGSEVRVSSAKLYETISQNIEINQDRPQLLFFFSDGEETSDNANTTNTFEPVAELILTGMVYGYGSEIGGEMKVQTGRFISGTPNEYIIDPTTGENAISTIDQDNLMLIAEELGVGYEHRELDTWPTIPDVQSELLSADNTIAVRGFSDYTWVIAFFLLGFMAFEAGTVLKQSRKIKGGIENYGQ